MLCNYRHRRYLPHYVPTSLTLGKGSSAQKFPAGGTGAQSLPHPPVQYLRPSRPRPIARETKVDLFYSSSRLVSQIRLRRRHKDFLLSSWDLYSATLQLFFSSFLTAGTHSTTPHCGHAFLSGAFACPHHPHPFVTSLGVRPTNSQRSQPGNQRAQRKTLSPCPDDLPPRSRQYASSHSSSHPRSLPLNTAKLSSPILISRTVSYDGAANPPRPGSSSYRAMADPTGRRRRSSSILKVHYEPPETLEQISDQAVVPNQNANWVNAKGQSNFSSSVP